MHLLWMPDSLRIPVCAFPWKTKFATGGEPEDTDRRLFHSQTRPNDANDPVHGHTMLRPCLPGRSRQGFFCGCLASLFEKSGWKSRPEKVWAQTARRSSDAMVTRTVSSHAVNFRLYKWKLQKSSEPAICEASEGAQQRVSVSFAQKSLAAPTSSSSLRRIFRCKAKELTKASPARWLEHN